MVQFEIIAVCPLHPTSIVTVMVEAPTHEIALGKAVGETVYCSLAPGHRFTIHAENVIGWQPLTPSYMPPRAEAGGGGELRRPEVYVPPPPSEKLYYISRESRDRVHKSDWWK